MLQVRNSRELLTPSNFKLKVLIYGLPGSGKTTWAAGALNPGFAVCEMGHGKGMLSIAELGLDYCEPSTYDEFMAVCQGKVFGDKDTIVVDSLTEMTRSFIKDHALTVPRKIVDKRRSLGVPDLNDYGTIAEITRKMLRLLLSLDKHIVVTATLAPPQEADPQEGTEARPGAPDLPGSMRLGSAAMFDHVFVLRTRPALGLTEGKLDPKKRYIQRYLLTEGDGNYIAKSRAAQGGQPVLPAEIVLDGSGGTWRDILQRITNAYAPAPASN